MESQDNVNEYLVKPEFFEICGLEESTLIEQNFNTLLYPILATFDLELTSIKDHMAAVTGWKETEDGFVFRIVLDQPEGRVPENGNLVLNLPTNPDSGSLNGLVLEHGKTNYGFDYIHCQLEVDSIKKEKVLESLKLRSENEFQDAPDKGKVKLSNMGFRVRQKLAPVLNLNTIAMFTAVLAMGVVSAAKLNTENEREVCQKLSEGASLHDGNYRVFTPKFKKNDRPRSSLEKMLNKPGRNPVEMIESCRENFEIPVTMEAAETSFQKTFGANSKK